MPTSAAVFIALDTETTGLNPDTNEILSIAIQLLDSALNLLQTKVVYAFPDGDVDPKAAAVNGYTLERWTTQGAVSQGVLFTEVHEFLQGHRNLIPVGHNVPFDLGFLKNLFKRHAKHGNGGYSKSFSYHTLDTVSVALFVDLVLFGKKTSSYKLTALCERFDIPLDNAHDALADVTATVALLRHLYTSMGSTEKRAEMPEPVTVSTMLRKKDDVWFVNGGKHKGRPLSALAVEAPGYLTWMLRSLDDLSPTQREVIENALAAA